MNRETDTALLERLSEREHRVLAALVEGLQSKQIAPLIDATPKRVDKIVEQIRVKLDAPTRQAAARRYREILAGEKPPGQPFPLSPPGQNDPSEPGVPGGAVFTFTDSAPVFPGLPWDEPRRRGAPKPWVATAPASRLVLMLLGTVALCVAILLVAGLMLGASLLR